MSATVVLVDEARRERAIQCVREAPPGYVVKIGEPTRTLAQNAGLWAALRDISQQVEWHGERMDETSWKHVLTAALYGQRTVPGIDGRLVVLGQSTSRMGKREFGDLLDLIGAFGADNQVQWSAEAREEFDRQGAGR